MADRSIAVHWRTEGLSRSSSRPQLRNKSATVDWGTENQWSATTPESPRWDCMATKSRRSNRSASCDSADVARAQVPARRRNETFSDAFESLHAKMTARDRVSQFIRSSYSPRRAEAVGESPEYSPPTYSRSICANTSASRLSEADRAMLLHVADRNSRALAKRAYRMLDILGQRPYARSSALMNGLLLSEAVPPHIDGYTLVENDRGTKIFQLDTGRDSSQRRHSRGAPHDRLRYLGFRKVKATTAEITELLGSRDDKATSVLNPNMTEVRRLHTLMDASEERPEGFPTGEDGRYVGLSWMCMQAPSRMGWKSSRLRDFLLLEDNSGFRAPDGRHGWVQSLHSVQLPWCASQKNGDCIVRGSMYQSGFVALPAKEAAGCWVDVMCAVEVDLKGGVSEKTHRASAVKRLSCLAALDQALVNQRLQRISFMETGQFEVLKPETERTCHICASRVRVFGRHWTCRKCANTMCKKCSVDLRVDSQRKKRRVCTRCVIKRAAPDPAFIAASSISPGTKPSLPHRRHDRRTSSVGGRNTIGLDEKLVGLLEDAAARSQSARRLQNTQTKTLELRNARSMTLPLASITEERRSSQAPPPKVATLSNAPLHFPRQPSVRYVDPSGLHHFGGASSQPLASAIRSASPSSPPRSPAPAVRSRRARAASARTQRSAQHSNWKNAATSRPEAEVHAVEEPVPGLDTTPPSARGSSLRVQFLQHEILM